MLNKSTLFYISLYLSIRTLEITSRFENYYVLVEAEGSRQNTAWKTLYTHRSRRLFTP